MIARRRALAVCLGAAVGGIVPLARAASDPPPPASHDPFGRVDPPERPPALKLTGEDGRPFDLGQRLRGKATAVQLMFTGCSATCPIQGALFADVESRLDDARCQLLSLSIDPLGDDGPALRRWLAGFGAARQWRAGVPRPQDLDRLLDFLRGRATGVDRHTGQVYLFDMAGRLVYRTPELPPPAYVAQMMSTVLTLR